MKIRDLLVDKRINDDTTIVIKDVLGGALVCGNRFQDKIVCWGSFSAILVYIEEWDVAILQMT